MRIPRGFHLAHIHCHGIFSESPDLREAVFQQMQDQLSVLAVRGQ